MRLSERLARLFMDDYQRALTDPGQYEAPVSASQVLAELEAGYGGRIDHETFGAMQSAVQDLGVRGDGTLTIAQVVRAKASMDRALSEPHDRSLHEWAVIANCGNSALAHYLIRRANLLAKGIKLGADTMLRDAFGLA